jgi:hypothetical protein
MSQSGRLKVTSSSLPPEVPTAFTADDSTVAVPAANNINIFSSFTTNNTDDGIRTTASGSTVTIELTNSFNGSNSTIEDNTVNLVNFALSMVPAVYLFEFYVVARDDATSDGAGIILTATAKTNGGVAEIIQTNYTEIKTSTSLVNIAINFTASGNDVNLDVTGIVGSTIYYKSIGRYITV